MSGSWSRGGFPPRRQKSKGPYPTYFLLDSFSIKDIQRWNNLRDEILKFHWDYYHDLAFQRLQSQSAIDHALLGATIPFRFEKWQRVVKYKYSVEPLLLEGSLNDIGGRFNIGDINPEIFPRFAGLYIAENKLTALEEALCQNIEPGREQEALDFALSDPSSMTNVSLSGSLDSVIDLNDPQKLSGFMDIIKNFSISDQIIKSVQKKGLPVPSLIKTIPKLMDVLLAKNWREWPNLFDVPATSQIFEQLVKSAGIEGILYPSKFSNKNCLVLYPQNFEDTTFVSLDDPAPEETKITRLGAEMWKKINFSLDGHPKKY